MFELSKKYEDKTEKTSSSSFGDEIHSSLEKLKMNAPDVSKTINKLSAEIKSAEIKEKNIKAANIAYAAAVSEMFSIQEQEVKEIKIKSPCGCFGD